MKRLLILLGLVLLTFTASGQNGQRTLTIDSQGTVTVPADIIHFNIVLNTEGEHPQETYNLHKEREHTLVRFLEKYSIREKDIHYQPISIEPNRNYNRRDDEPRYQTRQNVSLTLRDFETYEKIQVGLIEAGFDHFNGQFSSTKIDEAKDESIKRAIQNAREKAKLIAVESGVTLGNITRISYGDRSVSLQADQRMEMSASGQGSLMQYEQTVVVRASVTIEFAID